MKDHQNIVSGLKNDMISHAKAVKLLLTCSRQWAVMGITIVMDAVYPLSAFTSPPCCWTHSTKDVPFGR